MQLLRITLVAGPSAAKSLPGGVLEALWGRSMPPGEPWLCPLAASLLDSLPGHLNTPSKAVLGTRTTVFRISYLCVWLLTFSLLESPAPPLMGGVDIERLGTRGKIKKGASQASSVRPQGAGEEAAASRQSTEEEVGVGAAKRASPDPAPFPEAGDWTRKAPGRTSDEDGCLRHLPPDKNSSSPSDS